MYLHALLQMAHKFGATSVNAIKKKLIHIFYIAAVNVVHCFDTVTLS